MDKQSLQKGVNLGGWISQYPIYDHDAFKRFITAADIERISDWGMDHVRLPFDYLILEDDDQPGVYKESGFDYIESCLEWCEKNNLKLILDLHKAPGFSFDNLESNSLFSNPFAQERLLNLWEAITLRFKDRFPDLQAFELLNEVVLPSSSPWNVLASRVIKKIRDLDEKRLIVVGGNYYNIPEQLQYLELPEDSNLLYTFHFYKPFLVTHQLAPWIPFMVRSGQRVEYPGAAQTSESSFQLGDDPLIEMILQSEVGVPLDKHFLRSTLQPAFEFMHKTGYPLYCGEFGVIDLASLPTRLNWTRDFVGLLEEYHIGRAYWSYKAMDFGLVDQDGKVVSQELINILTAK